MIVKPTADKPTRKYTPRASLAKAPSHSLPPTNGGEALAYIASVNEYQRGFTAGYRRALAEMLSVAAERLAGDKD